MPKKPTGYASSSKGQSNPLSKEAVPMKNASIKPMELPNHVASMGKVTPNTSTIPKLSRPAKLTPRAPRI